jgi:hypothetical protein
MGKEKAEADPSPALLRRDDNAKGLRGKSASAADPAFAARLHALGR